PRMQPIADLVDDGKKLTATETMKIADTVRQWSIAAELPAEVGSVAIREAAMFIEQNPKYHQLDDAGRGRVYAAERAKLAKVWGTSVDQNLAVVRSVVEAVEAKRPRFKTFLATSGLTNSSALALQLFNHASRSRK